MAVAEARLSRRGVLAGGFLAAAGFLTAGLIDPPAAAARPGGGGGGGGHQGGQIGFQPIGPSTSDEVVVAPGYTARPFIPWGTPILGAFPAFVPGTPGEPGGVASGNTAAQQAEQIGMHHDGMTYFPLHNGPRGNQNGLLVLNHEYTDEFYLHTGAYVAGYVPTTAEGVRKSQNAHGVAVVEVQRRGTGPWEVVRSGRNRRITANTPMSFSGPAAGHRLVRTAADRQGRTPLGTFNNCANGETPWGTYLTCEENFNGYFRVDGTLDPESTRPRHPLRRGRRPQRLGGPRPALPGDRRRTPTSPTATAGSWRSTRSTRGRPRSSAPPSAG